MKTRRIANNDYPGYEVYRSTRVPYSTSLVIRSLRRRALSIELQWFRGILLAVAAVRDRNSDDDPASEMYLDSRFSRYSCAQPANPFNGEKRLYGETQLLDPLRFL